MYNIEEPSFVKDLTFTSPRMLDFVALDWDDTLNDTFLSLRRRVAEKGYPLPPEGVYLTTANTNGGLDVVLAEGLFMTERRVREGNDRFNQTVERLKKHGSSVGICTHRGFHPDAAALSEVAFAELSWRPDFVIILDPAKAGDKVEHLTEIFGEGNFTLVDDRPRWDAKHDLPENVWLMNQPWNQDVKTHDDFTRIASLHDLAIKLWHLDMLLTSPKFVTENMQSNWSMDCEIRLAMHDGILKRHARTDVEALLAFLSGKGISASQYASTYAEVGSHMASIPVSARQVGDVAAYRRNLTRLANGLAIVPIQAFVESEWNAKGEAYRDIRVTRRRTEDGFELGMVEYTLTPNPYATFWMETGTTIKWLGKQSHVLTPLANPVIYENDGVKHFFPVDAQQWAEEKRLRLIEAMVQTKTDPTTQLKLPEEILRVLTGVASQGYPKQATLAAMQYVATYSEIIGEVSNWKELTDYYLKAYPMSAAHIRQYLPTENVKIRSDEKRVQFIEVRAGVYIVNTAQGHDDAIAEWAGSHWLEARPVPTGMRVYPSILMLSQTSPKSYNAVSVPLGEITEAIKIVGLN